MTWFRQNRTAIVLGTVLVLAWVVGAMADGL